jgi:hypothetical protein
MRNIINFGRTDNIPLEYEEKFSGRNFFKNSPVITVARIEKYIAIPPERGVGNL